MKMSVPPSPPYLLLRFLEHSALGRRLCLPPCRPSQAVLLLLPVSQSDLVSLLQVRGRERWEGKGEEEEERSNA